MEVDMVRFILVVLLTGLSFARTKEDVDKLVEDSASVINELKNDEEKIPIDLLRRAKGVIVCPGLIKGAFIVGAGGGSCVVSYRNQKSGSWSAPAFYKIIQASVGFQLGVEAIDLLLVINTDRGMRSLIKSKVKLGADASVAAGPVGRSVSASTDVVLKADIYSYSKAKGIFAGVSLQGAILVPDGESIRIYYGKDLNPSEILFGNLHAPASALKFLDALRGLR